MKMNKEKKRNTERLCLNGNENPETKGKKTK